MSEKMRLHRVASGDEPPPAPTERSVPISGTTLVDVDSQHNVDKYDPMSEDWAVSEGHGSTLLDSDPLTHGRKEQLEQLIHLHNRALVSYVDRYVHSRRDAEDIVQEAYCRLFGLSDSGVPSQLSGYL